MANESLYRAKRMDNGQWVFWNELGKFATSQYGKLVSGKVGFTDWANELPVDPNTKGRYVGKLDMNGEKIFEKDIVKHYNKWWAPEAFRIVVIEWDAVKCRWCKTIPGTRKRYELLESCVLERIGNVYDNPELICGENT